ncbi:MAG: rhodanese-like domain-containing protein, partial [Thermodesulfovibrionales bacterium]
MKTLWKVFLVLSLSLVPWAAFGEQKPSLAPLCAGCHNPEPNMLMGTLDNISYKAGTIQLDLTSHKEIVKFDDATKVKNVENMEEMKKFKGKAFRIDFIEKKGEKVATLLTRFDVLKTLKPEDKISKEEFKKLRAEQKNLTVVDVRPLPRYEEGHVPGAIVIPAAAFDKHTDKLPKDKNTPLVFYCVGGCSSPLAAVKAKSLGYTSVKVYVGGMPEWVQTEYVLIKPVYLKNAIEQDVSH